MVPAHPRPHHCFALRASRLQSLGRWQKKGSVVPPSVFFASHLRSFRLQALRASQSCGRGGPRGAATPPQAPARSTAPCSGILPPLSVLLPQLPPLQPPNLIPYRSCLWLQWLRLGQKSLRWGLNALRSGQPRASASHACGRPPWAPSHPRCGVGCLPPALPHCVGFSAFLGSTCSKRGGGMVPVCQSIGKYLLIFIGFRSSVCQYVALDPP